MAKTAVALYQTLNDARQVVEELATAGYSRTDIQVIDPDGGNPDSGTPDGDNTDSGTPDGDNTDSGNHQLMLTQAGVPASDAEAYCTGLQHGAHLVMLTTTDDLIDAAMYIMESYDSINIHDQPAPWQTAKATDQSEQPSADTTGLPLVEEGIRYEEYQDEPGMVDVAVAANITPEQEYVEEGIRHE